MGNAMSEQLLAGWRPPEGYLPVESRLDGVTVYAPAPKVDTTPEAKTFKCPRCGASTAYDPAAASVTCASCGYVQPLTAQVVGVAAEAAEFTLETLEREQRGWGQERRELHCDACGANLSVAPGDLSTTCPFCASNRVVARVATSEGLRPRFVVPFKLPLDGCHKLAREWLGRGWMHPSGLASVAGSARFTGLYLPFWTFSARIVADWRAEVGYERTERYFDNGEWKTRTVIDWRWESGRVALPIRDQLEVGTTKLSGVLLKRLLPFDLNALAAYDPGFLAGWQAQGYDIGLPEAWDRARADMRETARRACRSDIASSHVRNLGVAAAFEDETWRYILLPVFAAAYRYAGQPYQLMINGQTGAVAGQKPVDWRKVWLVVAAALAPGVLLSLLGLPLLLAGGIGTVPLLIGAFLVVVGLAIGGYILYQAMEAGKA
jgi:hypothetical protein